MATDKSILMQGKDSLAYFGDLTEQLHESWYPLFGSKKSIAELDDIARRLMKWEAEGGMIYPSKENIFRVFKLVPLYEIKCVIIAQDPYPLGDATGVAFSGGRPNNVPHSLSVIWREVMRVHPKVQLKKLTNPCIEGWCQQGVFLFNQCLTVTHDRPGSHAGIWGQITSSVIRAIIEEKRSAPWILWGREAQRSNDVITKFGAVVLMGPHPAARGGVFKGGDHLLEVNRLLEEDGETPINWTSPHPCDEFGGGGE